MCGIAGGLRLQPNELDSMLASLSHRGPDGSGYYRSDHFSLGMTRLAVLDPEHGQQPFQSADQRIHAVCNGEIYNWLELRTELEQAGHRFSTRCDCEIIPAAWMEWGPQMLDRFNGMFALAVYDQQTDSLFLARDRCGQKPLYLTTGRRFVFGSEIKSLAAAGVPLEPDPTQLSNWLSLRYVPEPSTLYRNIQTLPAAHWLTVQADGTTQLRNYWKPPTAQPHIKPGNDTLQQLDQLALSSVELALQADAPTAAYLSAGVDSSLLVHYIKKLGAEITTLSMGFGAQSDENNEAATFASSLGLKHHTVGLQPESLADLPRVIEQMERPVGDPLILAFDRLASRTSELGCKVALGGEGPDEHFAGYAFQQAYVTAAKLGQLGRNLAATIMEILPGAVLDRFAKFPARLGPEGKEKTLRYLDQYKALSETQRSLALRTLFEPYETKQLIHPDLAPHQAASPNYGKPASSQDRLGFALRNQYRSWLPDWSLIRQDKNTMAHSLEYRAPFLDHRIIEFAFELPDSAKLSGLTNKVIWRKLAARHLSDAVTSRPKQPFYLPLEHPSWSQPFLTMAHDILQPSGYSCNGWLNPKAITPLLKARHFLPLKQLAAVVILQLWLNSLSASS